MAELHLLGSIEGAYKFENKTSLFCRYSIQTGPNWTIVSGFPEGQSATCKPDLEGHIHWSQPLDLHFMTRGIQGWPKILLQVCCLDSLGRSWTEGYSYCSVPTVPGHHEVNIPSWAPTAVSLTDRIRQYFLGGSPELVNTDIINLGIDRFLILTICLFQILYMWFSLHYHKNLDNQNHYSCSSLMETKFNNNKSDK